MATSVTPARIPRSGFASVASDQTPITTLTHTRTQTHAHIHPRTHRHTNAQTNTQAHAHTQSLTSHKNKKKQNHRGLAVHSRWPVSGLQYLLGGRGLGWKSQAVLLATFLVHYRWSVCVILVVLSWNILTGLRAPWLLRGGIAIYIVAAQTHLHLSLLLLTFRLL